MTDAAATPALDRFYPLFRRGKVRDTFDLGDGTLLMVATDRISAFDVVLPTAIPGKGRVLTQMSRWWFERTRNILGNHLAGELPPPPSAELDWPEVAARSMRVRRAERIDIECVVRGHISGSGWKEYLESGTLASEALPPGLSESAPLPEPRFTPAAKNDDGHDVNISRAELAERVGAGLASRLEQISLELFAFGVERCRRAGIILADTKFELGFLEGDLILIDELFTPDSSRFWEASQWREGEPAASFDKQFVRDHLEAVSWNKRPPGPELPEAIVSGTGRRYREAASRICGIDVQ